MNTAYDVYFSNGFAIILLHHVQHLFDAKFPSFFAFGIEPAIAAEITTEHTDIGRFNMEIAVVENLVAVLFIKLARLPTNPGLAFSKSSIPSSSLIRVPVLTFWAICCRSVESPFSVIMLFAKLVLSYQETSIARKLNFLPPRHEDPKRSFTANSIPVLIKAPNLSNRKITFCLSVFVACVIILKLKGLYPKKQNPYLPLSLFAHKKKLQHEY
jgi:hypothetical protein